METKRMIKRETLEGENKRLKNKGSGEEEITCV